MKSRLGAEGLGRHVDAVGRSMIVPASAAMCTWAKNVGSASGSNTPPPLTLVERDIADGAVLEAQAEVVVADHLDGDDIDAIDP